MAPKTKPAGGKRDNGLRIWCGSTPELDAAVETYHARLSGPDGLRISRAEAVRSLVLAGLRAEGIGGGVES